MVMLKKYIKVSFELEGFHKYPDAPAEVAFLRQLHRHMFGVRAKISVTHNERELEFIMVKRELEKFMKNRIKEDMNNSCETLAADLGGHILKVYGINRTFEIEVNEDGENGAIVEWSN